MKRKIKIVPAISDVLTSLVKLTRFLIMFFLLGLFLLGSTETALAQAGKLTLSGLVKDEAGAPLPGVTIQVKGSSTGTLTDNEGKYTLETSQTTGTLLFSFIGLQTQEILFSASGTFDVVMKISSIGLDEVVVVGYGVQKMKNVTGAISTISPQEINELPVGNLGAALVGQVNGLSVSGGQARPGVGASMEIRQPFNLSKDGGSTSPIYVIDDFVADETTFNNLVAEDIENITILKDAAAAIYGARSSQGAILVKTKRGKEGAPRISFSSQITYNDEVKRPEMLNAYEYGLFYNRYYGINGANNFSSPVTTFFQADELDTMKTVNYDWLDDAWQGSTSTNQNVNISGGSSNATYFASMSYFSQNGNLATLNYNRWNYRAGTDIKVANHLKVSLQLSGDYGDRKQTFNKIGGEIDENDYLSLLTTPGYMPAYIDGLPIVRFGPSNSRKDNIQLYNFFAIEDLANIKDNVPTNMRINSSIEYDFGWSRLLDGFKLKLTYSKGIYSNIHNQLGSQYNGYSFKVRPGSGQHLYEGVSTSLSNLTLNTVNNGNRLLRDGERTDSYQLNFYGMYERSFGRHNVNALFSIERQESANEFVRFYIESPMPFTNGQSATATGAMNGQTTRSESGMLSYIGRFNYSYADKYLFEFLFRSDASTKFAPKYYWGSFPSFSAGWVISEEGFFKDKVNWMDFLKLRASLGFLGKDNAKAWLWRQRYTPQINKGAVFGLTTSANIGYAIKMEAAPNPDATWDDDTKYNLGIDAKFLKSRLSVTVDAYFDHSTNLLIPRTATVPVTVGGALADENFGAIDAYGIELSLGWRDKIGSDLSYFVRIFTGLDDARWRKKDWPDVIKINEARPDGPYDVGAWGYDCLGMFRSQADIDKYVADYTMTDVLGFLPAQLKPGMLYYRDVRGAQDAEGNYAGPDGIINENDYVQLSKKSSNPYGFTLNFGGEWKGLSLSAMISSSWGGFSEISGSARYLSQNYSQFMNVPKFWNDMFTESGNVYEGEANIDAKYPNMYFDESTLRSSFWQISSFRMALRTMNLGYSLPKSLINKIGIDGCRIMATGMNLLSFYNPLPGKYMDINSSYGSFPNLRSMSLGINLTF